MPLCLFNAIRTHRWPAGPCFTLSVREEYENNRDSKRQNIRKLPLYDPEQSYGIGGFHREIYHRFATFSSDS